MPGPVFQVQQQTALTQPGTRVQDWRYPMLPKTPRAGTASTEVTSKEVEKVQYNHPTSSPGALLMGSQFPALHALENKLAAQEKGLSNDRQNKRVFPMPGRGHRVSTDHRKYDPSKLEHLNTHNCQTAFRTGFSFLSVLTLKFSDFFKWPH